MNNPFKKALPIIERLINEGYDAFFVGGSVRDYLLKRPTGDIDIATSATPETVMSIFQRTIPIGLDHGTVVVQTDDDQFEVTTFRTDSDYKDFRHPDAVEFVSTIEEDLKRRDFTINAIAMTKEFNIIDPYNGCQDLKNRKIVAVGKPEERFYEDPLRMMRGIRFMSQLSFELDHDTFLAIEKHAKLIENISIERISVEFDKLLKGDSPNKAIEVLADSQLTQYLPCLKGKQDNFRKLSTLSLNELDHLYESWALLIVFLQIKDIHTFFKLWKRSNNLQKQVSHVVTGLESKEMDEWFLYVNGLKYAKSILRIKSIINNDRSKFLLFEKLEEDYKDLPIKSRSELIVNGRDLLTWYQEKPPGPWVSEQLMVIEKAVVYGHVKNDKERIKEWLECNLS